MKTNLKDNIWIEGFDTAEEARERFEELVKLPNGTEYAGETSEIPEEVAKECVSFDNDKRYRDYLVRDYQLSTANQSIQSACDKPYCVIYKTE